MKKRWCAILLATMFLLPTPALAFSDTSGHWAQQAIDTLVHAKMVSGYPDGSFLPNRNIAREEVASMFGKLKTYVRYEQGDGLFDIEDSWAKDSIERLMRQHVINGYGDRTFRPKNNITRAEFCAMFFNLLIGQDRLDYSTEYPPLTFTDSGDFSDWMVQSVEALVATGYINGYPDGSFRPNAAITRAEVSAILAKLGDFLPGTPTVLSKFEGVPVSDQLEMDAILKKAGADENYRVLNQLENKYELYLPNFLANVELIYHPEQAQKFSVSTGIWDIDIYQDQLQEYFIDFETQVTVLERVEAYFETQGKDIAPEYWFDMQYNEENGTIDQSKHIVSVKIYDNTSYRMVYSMQGELLDITVLDEELFVD